VDVEVGAAERDTTAPASRPGKRPQERRRELPSRRREASVHLHAGWQRGV